MAVVKFEFRVLCLLAGALPLEPYLQPKIKDLIQNIKLDLFTKKQQQKKPKK
jgi:hypothetical protein